ncbi:MAG: restriction endonuclease [Dehalococcoidia bacterium]|nr:restriction endonuclease [Dehalococcoidia bacterium]
MRKFDLKEHCSKEERLNASERAVLVGHARALDLSITPTSSEDTYILRPGSTVGAVEIDGLSVRIEPKIGITQLLSIACYAIDKVKFQPTDFDFPEHPALSDALAIALERAARYAFARGLLHGYRTEEEALHTVRGRIRFDDQLRRRFGVPLPVEVRYDEFTDDIPANRVIKAAARRLAGMRLRSDKARVGLGWIAAMLDNVSLREYAPNDVPDITFDRLNAHYRAVVALARLVLQRNAFEAARGAVRASGFLMDMNEVFQGFVTVALRDVLGLTEREFGEYNVGTLDEEGESGRLRPDLVWRGGARDIFVGDAKYKNITGERVPNTDLYQLLAYTTALNLPGGLLIYAKGEADAAAYTVRNAGKRLEVAALDLEGTLDDVLARIARIAEDVRRLAGKAPSVRLAS